MERVLEKVGLTRNEAKIFLTLLEHGPLLAGIISRKSGIHRRTVYDSLERLIKKGLVSYIVTNNRKYFEAANPERVMQILKEKEESIADIMPKLLVKYKFSKEKQETVFYKGKNGLKTVFEDQIAVGKEILILGASPIANKTLKYYFHWFDKRRKQKGISVRMITQRGAVFPKIPLCKKRFIPKRYSSPSAINIYGNRVAIILWSEEAPFAILIKNKEIADGYKKYFELMWEVAKV